MPNEKTLDESIDEMEDVVESLYLEWLENKALLAKLKMHRAFRRASAAA